MTLKEESDIMQFFTNNNQWDTELTDQPFIDWFVRESELGHFGTVAAGLRTLDGRHTNMVCQAFLALERRSPLRKENTDAEKSALALSGVVQALGSDCPGPLVELLFEVGTIFIDEDLEHRALFHCDQMEKFPDLQGDLVVMARIWSLRGGIYIDLNDAEHDLPCLWRALALFQTAYSESGGGEADMFPVLRGLAHLQHRLALKCRSVGENDQALLYNFRALAIRERLTGGDDRGRASSHGNISACYDSMGNIGPSLSHALKDFLYISGNPDVPTQYTLKSLSKRTTTYTRFASTARGLQEHAIAVSVLERAGTFGYQQGTIKLLMAGALASLDKLTEAVTLLQELGSPAYEMSFGHRLARCDLLAQIQKSMGNETEATRSLEEAVDLLQNEDYPDRISDDELQTRVRIRLNRLPATDYLSRARMQRALGESSLALEEVHRGLNQHDRIYQSDRIALEKMRDELSFGLNASIPDTSPNSNPVPCRACNPGTGASVNDLCEECQSALALEETVEVPAGKVKLSGSEVASVGRFWIDKVPVTNRLFAYYQKARRLDWKPFGWTRSLFSHPGQPVTHVSWQDCQEFCEWRSRLTRRKYRLPSKEEWLRAAVGEDDRLYPWGNDEPDHTRAAFCLFEDADAVPAPVGMFPEGASPFGALDMSGNVWEWTSSAHRGSKLTLGGSCGTEAQSLNPRDLSFQSLEALKEDSRDYPLVGFRCLTEEGPDV